MYTEDTKQGKQPSKHQQGCNPHLQVIPDRPLSIATLLCLNVTSCNAMAGSRLKTHGWYSGLGVFTCNHFIRHYSGNPCWFLFLCQLVCLSLAGHSAHHQVRFQGSSSSTHSSGTKGFSQPLDLLTGTLMIHTPCCFSRQPSSSLTLRCTQSQGRIPLHWQ